MPFSFRNLFSQEESSETGKRGDIQDQSEDQLFQEYLVGELLPFIPPAIVAQSGIPMEETLLIALPEDGTTDVPLSTVYQMCPDLFAAEITPLNDSVITLPPKAPLEPPQLAPQFTGNPFESESIAEKRSETLGSPVAAAEGKTGASNPFQDLPPKNGAEGAPAKGSSFGGTPPSSSTPPPNPFEDASPFQGIFNPITEKSEPESNPEAEPEPSTMMTNEKDSSAPDENPFENSTESSFSALFSQESEKSDPADSAKKASPSRDDDEEADSEENESPFGSLFREATGEYVGPPPLNDDGALFSELNEGPNFEAFIPPGMEIDSETESPFGSSDETEGTPTVDFSAPPILPDEEDEPSGKGEIGHSFFGLPTPKPELGVARREKDEEDDKKGSAEGSSLFSQIASQNPAPPAEKPAFPEGADFNYSPPEVDKMPPPKDDIDDEAPGLFSRVPPGSEAPPSSVKAKEEARLEESPPPLPPESESNKTGAEPEPDAKEEEPPEVPVAEEESTPAEPEAEEVAFQLAEPEPEPEPASEPEEISESKHETEPQEEDETVEETLENQSEKEPEPEEEPSTSEPEFEDKDKEEKPQVEPAPEKPASAAEPSKPSQEPETMEDSTTAAVKEAAYQKQADPAEDKSFTVVAEPHAPRGDSRDPEATETPIAQSSARNVIPTFGVGDYGIRDIELRAIFDTDENFTLRKVSQKVAAMEGVAACAVVTNDRVIEAYADQSDAIGDKIQSMAEHVRGLAALSGMKYAPYFSIQMDQGFMTFFFGETNLLAVKHKSSEFKPGGREKLIIVARCLENLEN